MTKRARKKRRELTPQEQEIVNDKLQLFPKFLSDVNPGIHRLMKQVIDHPEPYLYDLEKFLPVLEDWLRDLDLSSVPRSSWPWLELHIGYVYGTLLACLFDPTWQVCQDPDSKFFGRFVLGQFKHGVKKGLIVDPFEAVAECLETPPPRSFLSQLHSTIQELNPYHSGEK